MRQILTCKLAFIESLYYLFITYSLKNYIATFNKIGKPRFSLSYKIFLCYFYLENHFFILNIF